MQLMNEGKWLEALKIAERNGGVTLGETECAALRIYIQSLRALTPLAGKP